MLRGMGALMALPLLEQMIPRTSRGAGAPPPPLRVLSVFTPNGFNMSTWHLQGGSAAGTPLAAQPMSTALQPFADLGLTGDISVLTGLANVHALPDLSGAHHRGTSGFISAATCLMGPTLHNGVSFDQLVAQQLKGQTRLPSLELGPVNGSDDTGTNLCGADFACAYVDNISWLSETTPAAREGSPQRAFDRLFAGDDPLATQQQIEQRHADRLSVIDFVKSDLDDLKGKLGRSDNLKVDEYVQGVRDLEGRIQSLGQLSLACPMDRMRPTAEFSTDNIGPWVNAMFDVMVLALQCDLTRVATLMTGGGGNNGSYKYSFVLDGFPDIIKYEKHHELSHHQGDATKLAALTQIDQWNALQVAGLVKRLKDTKETDGSSLLDHTALLFSSELSDGNSHSHVDLPVVLAGHAGGVLSPGRHILYDNDEPIANLFISLLNIMGVPATTFGNNGTHPLASI
jgi:hypothetical protein